MPDVALPLTGTLGVPGLKKKIKKNRSTKRKLKNYKFKSIIAWKNKKHNFCCKTLCMSILSSNPVRSERTRREIYGKTYISITAKPKIQCR